VLVFINRQQATPTTLEAAQAAAAKANGFCFPSFLNLEL